MRKDCRHYESRTYASGEVVQMCRLDLAPEAPWRCPSECPQFTKRAFDAGWVRGSLEIPDTPAPPPPGADVAGLLDQAEDIVNAVGPETLIDVLEERAKARRKAAGLVGRLRDRFRRRSG